MNLVDLAIIILLVLTAVHGVTQGAALQVLSFGGFWLGLLLGAAIAPLFSRSAQSPFAQAFISLVTFLGLALIGGAVGRLLGTHAWSALQRYKLGHFDSALGAVVAVIAALGAIWLVALMVSGLQTKNVSLAVKRSLIVRTLVETLPPAPSVFARLQQFVAGTPFPRVFEGLEPAPAGPVDVPGNALVQGAVRTAGRSTVRINGLGCGGIQTGSGFVVGNGLVMTNAHVVAGIGSPRVQEAGADHGSTPVLFDPQLDIAILRTDGLAAPPLNLLNGDAPRGQGGAIIGYPGGGQFRAGAAAILREFNAIGRDIYGRGLTRRNVYQLQAQIVPGNSGGPFVRQDGVVLGVVFAASTSDSNVGYAITSAEAAKELAKVSASAVSTGPCA